MSDGNVEGQGVSAGSQSRLVQIFKFILQFLQKYQKSASNSVSFFVIGGFEQLLETLSFQCPINRTLAKWYSATILFGPVIVLFLLGIVMQKKTWFSIYGCRSRKEKKTEKGSETETPTTTEHCSNLCATFGESCILPFGWLSFALMDGDYVACFYTESPNDYNFWKRISAVFAWLFLIVVGIFSVAVICCVRCTKSETYLQRRYVKMLRAKEEELVLKCMEENIKLIVPARAEKFMEAHTFTHKDWQLLTRIEPIDQEIMTKIINQKKAEAIPVKSPLEAWIVYKEKAVQQIL